MLKWLLFDLNSYFASCEQQVDVLIRGKPVAVVPMLADSTCVIAASYEAKKFGIKTGTRLGDAKKMCPGLILKTGNHKLYTEFHHKIIAAVQEVLPIKKVLSIDEVACELIGKEREFENARRIAQQMKDHVRKVVGSEIKSSVGIGPNILIAKIASDMQKPDGLIMVSTDQILEKIGPLPINALPGVGRQMNYRLNAKGYFTIADFIKAPDYELRKHWGSIWGLRVSRELAGEDIAYNKNPNQGSLSHQHVLPPNLRTPEKSFQVVTKLLLKAAARLRDEKLKTRRLSVYVKFQDGTRFENSISFSDSDDTYFLVDELKKLWNKLLNTETHKKPLKVAIALSDLMSGPSQLSLFDNPKKNSINHALDSINTKYGSNTLFLASTKEVLSSAKTRISFNHIPKLDEEFDEDYN
ncbi:MAG: DNA polymerase [Bdellovibrionota bacterium]